MEVNSEQSLWIILSITHLAPVLISSMVLWLMQATRRWVCVRVGGGVRRRRRGGGVLRVAGATSRAARAARSGPRGDPRAVGSGGMIPTGGFGWWECVGGAVSQNPPPPPPHIPDPRLGSAAELSGSRAGFYPRVKNPESKVSGKEGRSVGLAWGETRSGPGGGTPTPGEGGNTDTDTPAGRPSAAALLPARSAHAPLLVNY